VARPHRARGTGPHVRRRRLYGNVDGSYAFHAAESGAALVTGIDLARPTPEFVARNDAAGGVVRFVQGDLNDPALAV
jgi:hypothetical protein